MNCPLCNQVHADSARFCPVTGLPIPQPGKTCPTCGKLMPAQAAACPFCEPAPIVSDTLPTKHQPPPAVALEQALSLPVPDQAGISATARLWMRLLGSVLVLSIVSGIFVVWLFFEYPGFFNDTLLKLFPPAVTGERPGVDQPALEFTIPPLDSTPTPKTSPTAAASAPAPTDTPPPAPSPVPIETPALVITDPVTGAISNPLDGAALVYIPAGDFWMGSESAEDPYFWGAESPRHQVFLDGFWIYQAEVSNALLRACALAGVCQRPEKYSSWTRPDYFENDAYAGYPVIYVDYATAAAYCQWAGGRLPTEAEWEKTARGDQDTRLFPWGSSAPDGSKANLCDADCAGSPAEQGMNDGFLDTAPPGTYPAGASPYGVFDMAGNVMEWVSDYFSSSYYRDAPRSNPGGPPEGARRVARGGSFGSLSEGLRVVARTSFKPDSSSHVIGFRCVIPAP